MSEISARDIEALVRSFDDSGWDELRVVIDGLELCLSKDPADQNSPAPIAEPEIAARSAVPVERAASAEASSWRSPPSSSTLEIPPGVVVVRAPNLGTFHRAPKPGAPPCVTVGQRVDVGAELCLLEVVKLFTSLASGVRGVVHDILVEDSQLVEFDQPLFLIDTAD
jgi:acetyl-CoA carboxylase biotin carboxyl carrier protein